MWKFIKSHFIRLTTVTTDEPLVTVNTRSRAYKELRPKKKLILVNRLDAFLSGNYISVGKHNQILKLAKLTGQIMDTEPKPPTNVYLHIKSQNRYTVLHHSVMLTSSLVTMTVYECLNSGKIWVRPSNEFNDGRFERVE